MAWGMTGLVFGLFRWRKLLIIMPITILLLLIFIPQIRDRIMVGFDSTEETGYTESGDEVDVKTLTAGRDGIWRLSLEQFREAPLFGHGRLAILRTGINRQAILEFRESFGHPHCAYIEQLIDNGVIGLGIVLLFYLAMVRKSFSLLRDNSNPLYAAVGGIALAIILTQLIASLTAQSFYPRQGVVGMWCAIGLMLRVYVEREKARKAHTPTLIWEQDNRSQNNR
jgi:O-antigen ligase